VLLWVLRTRIAIGSLCIFENKKRVTEKRKDRKTDRERKERKKERKGFNREMQYLRTLVAAKVACPDHQSFKVREINRTRNRESEGLEGRKKIDCVRSRERESLQGNASFSK
jgi:hypothetical protein